MNKEAIQRINLQLKYLMLYKEPTSTAALKFIEEEARKQWRVHCCNVDGHPLTGGLGWRRRKYNETIFNFFTFGFVM